MGDSSDEVDGQVRDDPEHSRLVVDIDGMEGELAYSIELGRLIILHTGVAEDLRRHGVGSRLVEAAVKKAKAENLTIVPVCPFALRWLHDNPAVADTIPIESKLPTSPN